MLRIAALALVICTGLTGLAGSVRADQTDVRLDDLFDRLRATSDGAEGRRITRQIRIIWRQSENPSVMDAMANAGWQLYQKRFQAALEALDHAVSLEPEYAEVWSRRAAVYYVLGDYTSALQDIRRTLALEPRHFGALAELGAIYMRLEQFEAAKAALEQALAINPHLRATRRNLDIVERRLAGDPA